MAVGSGGSDDGAHVAALAVLIGARVACAPACAVAVSRRGARSWNLADIAARAVSIRARVPCAPGRASRNVFRNMCTLWNVVDVTA